MLEDRGYQTQAIDDVLAAWSTGAKNVCLSMPTGSGKTATAARIAVSLHEDGARAAFVTDRLPIMGSAQRTMQDAGLTSAIVQGDRTADQDELAAADVLICSSQTLQARNLLPDDLGVLAGIIDECDADRLITRQWLASAQVMLGLTATPLARWMTEETPLQWNALVQPLTTREAMNAGWLLEPLFRADIPDPTEAVNERPAGAGGDWSDQQAESIMSPYLQQTVDAWIAMVELHERDGGFGGLRIPTIVQACTIHHAEALAQAFTASTGDIWVAVTANTSQDESERHFENFEAGRVAGLVSVSKILTGFDSREATCFVSARPTNRLRTWIQAIGRIMRTPIRGLHRAVVLDTAGNGHRFAGRLHRFWSHGAVWPLGTPEARDGVPGETPDIGAVQPCLDHPTIVQPPGSQVCVVCHAPLKPVEPPKDVKVWKDAIDADELGRSVIVLARQRLLRGDDPGRVANWARMQVKTLTDRWPARSWPVLGAPDPFAVERPHPVVGKLIKKNLAAWRNWQTQDPEDRPPEPPADRITLAERTA